MPLLVDDEIAARIDRLELPFNPYGVDPFGISKKYLAVAMTALGLFYRRYFRVKSFGHENVPARGRADGLALVPGGFDDRFQGHQTTKLYLMNRDGTNSHSLSDKLDRDIQDPQWAFDNSGVYVRYDDQGDDV